MTKVAVEIRTVTERTSSNGSKFWSFNVADSGFEGFARLPQADVRSYTLNDAKGWDKIKKALETAAKAHNAKSGFWQKTDSKGNTFWSSAAGETEKAKVSCVLVLEIELADGYVMTPTFSTKVKNAAGGMGATVLNLQGVADSTSIRVRPKRPGNSVR